MARAKKKAPKKKPSKRRVKNPTERSAKWIIKEYDSGRMHFEDSEIHGADFFGDVLDGAVFTGSDITATNFVDALMVNVDLSHSTVKRCDFDAASMGQAMLWRSEFRGCRFVDTKLEGADFTKSWLEDTSLAGANLTGAVLYETTVKGGSLQDAVLKEAAVAKIRLSNLEAMRMKARESKWERAEVKKVAFDYSEMWGSILVKARFEECSFEDVDLTLASLNSAEFITCIFKGTNFREAVGYASSFVGCEFDGTILEDTNLSDSLMNESVFSAIRADGLNLSGSSLRGVKFLDCDLTKAKLNRAYVDDAIFSHSPLSDATLAEIDLSVAKQVDDDTMERWREIRAGRVVAGAAEVPQSHGRDDENLAWSMEHQTPGVGDEERAARWRDEDVEISGAKPPAELMGAAEETDDALRAWMQPGIKQKLGVWNPKKSLPWKRLITRCQKLWEAYDEKPLKRNLVAFGEHIEKMKASKSVRVKTEANRARRSYNKEMKTRGWTAPKAKKKASKKKAKKKTPKPKRRSTRKNPPPGFQFNLMGGGVQDLKDGLAAGTKSFGFALFDGKDLSHMDLSGTKFRSSQFNGASFEGSDLSNADMDEQVFIQTEFGDAYLLRTTFRNANLTHAVLRSADAREAVFDGANLLSADMAGGQFDAASFEGALLRAVDGSGANFSMADLSRAHLDGALLRDAEFTGAMLDNTHLQHANLSGADFSGATFKNMRWKDVDLRLAKNVDPAVISDWSRVTGLTMGQSSPIVPMAPVAPVPHVVRPKRTRQSPQQVRAAIAAAQASQSTGWSQAAAVESLRRDLEEVVFEADEGDALRRDDENLRFSMEHQVPGVADEEAASRWRDEEVDEDSPEWVKRGMTFEEWMRTSNPKKKRGRKKKATKRKVRKKKSSRLRRKNPTSPDGIEFDVSAVTKGELPFYRGDRGPTGRRPAYFISSEMMAKFYGPVTEYRIKLRNPKFVSQEEWSGFDSIMLRADPSPVQELEEDGYDSAVWVTSTPQGLMFTVFALDGKAVSKAARGTNPRKATKKKATKRKVRKKK